MQTFVRPVLAATLLSVSAASCFASAEPVATQRIEITAARAAAAASQSVLALRDYEQAYTMSSGRRMVVTSFGDAVRVSYGRRAAKTLRHDGLGSFVSRDGQLVLRFDLDSHGQAHNVRLSLPADQL